MRVGAIVHDEGKKGVMCRRRSRTRSLRVRNPRDDIEEQLEAADTYNADASNRSAFKSLLVHRVSIRMFRFFLSFPFLSFSIFIVKFTRANRLRTVVPYRRKYGKLN